MQILLLIGVVVVGVSARGGVTSVEVSKEEDIRETNVGHAIGETDKPIVHDSPRSRNTPTRQTPSSSPHGISFAAHHLPCSKNGGLRIIAVAAIVLDNNFSLVRVFSTATFAKCPDISELAGLVGLNTLDVANGIAHEKQSVLDIIR